MPLPPNITDKLIALGIRAPLTSPWKRMRAAADGVIYQAEGICSCGDRPKRVSLVPFQEAGREILIGQCGACGVILWCDWAAETRQWTGASVPAETRPLYRAGHGA